MQVIQGTFDAWAGMYRNVGPFEYGVSVDPMANIYAALNYGKHGAGFGSGPGQIGSGHGYDTGGRLPTGLSMAWNRSGGSERVLSHAEEDVLHRLADNLGGFSTAGVESLLRRLVSVTGAQADALAGALSGGARRAAYAGMYSPR